MCSLGLALLGCSPKPSVGFGGGWEAQLGAPPGPDPLLCQPALEDWCGVVATGSGGSCCQPGFEFAAL